MILDLKDFLCCKEIDGVGSTLSFKMNLPSLSTKENLEQVGAKIEALNLKLKLLAFA